MPVTSSNPAFDSFVFICGLLLFSQNKTGKYDFIAHSNEFYTYTISAFS